MMVMLRFWPGVHLLTFSVVPQHLRVLWVDVVEVVCLDECGMGPNVQCGEDGPIVNGVKTQDDVDEAVAKAKAE